VTRFQKGADYKEITHQAQTLFDRALAIDPNNADALAGSAFTYFVQYYYGWRPDITDYDAKVLGQADRAISLDPNNMQAYYAKSFYLNGTKRPRDGLRAADQGLAIDPNNASLYNARGYSKINLGQFDEAKSDILKAIELSPRDPQMGLWRANLSDAEMGLGNYDAANRSVAARNRFWLPHKLFLSGTCSRLCTCRQDGGSKDCLGRGAEVQSQSDDQIG